MKQIKTKKRTKTLATSSFLFPLTCTFLISNLLLGCATAGQHDRTVSIILDKENILIQKIKIERAKPELIATVQKDRNLSDAEAHLLMALDELSKANAKVQTVLLNQPNTGEKKNE